MRFKVGLYSVGGPANKKYVVISTYGGAGVSAAVDGTTIAKNSDTERGYYLESYEVGIGPADRNQTVLQIESRAPEAANRRGHLHQLDRLHDRRIGRHRGQPGRAVQPDRLNTGSIAIPDFAVRYTASTTQARWVYAWQRSAMRSPTASPTTWWKKRR